MLIFYCDHFVLPLPDDHRFPMTKYVLLRDRITRAQLVPPGNMRVPDRATDAQLLRVHDRAYIDKITHGTLTRQEIRKIGFPWSPQLNERSRRSVGGTIAACRAAFDDGIAVNLAGGTHHAYRDSGGGYCVFNDAVVAARAMQAEGFARRVAIIDCDVHQGNGSASICADDASIFTFSMHAAHNYPFHKEPGDLDIELPDDTGDACYLALLDEGLQRVLAHFNPDLAIYLAGADPFVGDRLGRLALTKDGLAARDHLVLTMLRAAAVPVAVVMSGGYAPNVDDIVDIHFATVQTALRVSAGLFG